MRVSALALTCLAAIALPGLAVAAAADSPFMSHAQIMGLIEKAKADRKGDAANTIEPILSLAPYRSQLEYRTASAPAAVHETDAELMVVLQGQGNIITGGKLVNEKRNNAHNLGGDSIMGGVDHNVVVGDTIFVPANSPHQVIPSGGAPIVLMTMHVAYPPENWPAK
jgi:mannose-6-phosphate isomerase-like protein (cupin superfamily)